MIALQDADHESALQLVKAKLHDAGIDVQFSREETDEISCLGGRAGDLTTVCPYPTRYLYGPTYQVYSSYTK
jgi:hypothetical protein